jgi:hypothetical protein
MRCILTREEEFVRDCGASQSASKSATTSAGEVGGPSGGLPLAFPASRNVESGACYFCVISVVCKLKALCGSLHHVQRGRKTRTIQERGTACFCATDTAGIRSRSVAKLSTLRDLGYGSSPYGQHKAEVVTRARSDPQEPGGGTDRGSRSRWRRCKTARS